MLEEVHLRVLDRQLTHIEARRLRMGRLLELAGDEAGEPMALVECYQGAYIRARAAVPGAAALLATLAPRVMIGIVTNNTLSEQRIKLDICGLAPYVDELVASQDVGVAKPDPRIFAIAMERLGVHRDRTVMVGDSWSADVEGAAAAGVRAVWFNARREVCPDRTIAQELTAFEPLDRALDVVLSQIPGMARAAMS
jgi:HAD superfamily hydrolase (TIGR01509 family)